MPAVLTGGPLAGLAARRPSGKGSFAFVALGILWPSAAAAQVGAVASVFSDDRYQGISISDGRPVGILDLSYDSASGLYGSASGSVVATRDDGLKALQLVLNAGYAMQLRSELSADVGAIHSRYSHYSGLAGAHDYTEVYAGLNGRFLGARLSFSPDYLGAARGTVRGEVNGHISLTPKLLLDGEVGLLTPLGRRGYGSEPQVQSDVRIGLAQRLGRITLHAAVTARSGGENLYSGHGHSRTALVLGISSAL